MIEYDTIAIKKIEPGFSDSYNTRYISMSELVFINNPFSNYLKKVFSPIKKSIKKTLPRELYPHVLDNIDNDFSFVCHHSVNGLFIDVLYGFEEYLKMIEEIDQKNV